MIISPLMILGRTWEQATGTQCLGTEGTRFIGGEFEDYIEFADLMDGKRVSRFSPD